MRRLRNLLADETGVAMAEYALLLGLISIVAISVLTLMSPELKAKFQSVVDSLKK